MSVSCVTALEAGGPKELMGREWEGTIRRLSPQSQDVPDSLSLLPKDPT